MFPHLDIVFPHLDIDILVPNTIILIAVLVSQGVIDDWIQKLPIMRIRM